MSTEKRDAGAGAEVRRLRRERGLTLEQLGHACGVSKAFIGQIETGTRVGFGPDMLFKLSHALGVGCAHWRAYFAPDLPPTDLPPRTTPKPRGRPKKSPDTAPADLPAAESDLPPEPSPKSPEINPAPAAVPGNAESERGFSSPSLGPPPAAPPTPRPAPASTPKAPAKPAPKTPRPWGT